MLTYVYTYHCVECIITPYRSQNMSLILLNIYWLSSSFLTFWIVGYTPHHTHTQAYMIRTIWYSIWSVDTLTHTLILNSYCIHHHTSCISRLQTAWTCSLQPTAISGRPNFNRNVNGNSFMQSEKCRKFKNSALLDGMWNMSITYSYNSTKYTECGQAERYLPIHKGDLFIPWRATPSSLPSAL